VVGGGGVGGGGGGGGLGWGGFVVNKVSKEIDQLVFT